MSPDLSHQPGMGDLVEGFGDIKVEYIYVMAFVKKRGESIPEG